MDLFFLSPPPSLTLSYPFFLSDSLQSSLKNAWRKESRRENRRKKRKRKKKKKKKTRKIRKIAIAIKRMLPLENRIFLIKGSTMRRRKEIKLGHGDFLDELQKWKGSSLFLIFFFIYFFLSSRYNCSDEFSVLFFSW